MCDVPTENSLLDVCSSTQDETPAAPWQQPLAPSVSVSSVASMLTYPPHIAPVPPPAGIALTATRPLPVSVPGAALPMSGPGPQLAAVRTPVGVPLPVGVLPPAGSVGGPLPPGSVGIIPPTGSVGGPVPPRSVSVLPPAGNVGGPLPPGSVSIIQPTGSVGGPVPSGSVRFLPPAGNVGVGGLPPPGNASVLPPAGSVGGPAPTGVPPPSLPAAGTLPFGSRSSVAASLPTRIPPPANVLPLAGVPRPLGVPPVPKFVAGFDPSVPPPCFTPPVSSTVVASVSETPARPASRPAEDMDLDNSTSSEDDLGEGFEEEWPICSRRTSSKFRGSSQYDPFVRDRGAQLSQSRASGSTVRSAELNSLPDKPSVQSGDYFQIGFEQPSTGRMFGTTLPVTGNNFAVLSGSLDRVNPLPVSSADASPACFPGGTASVRSLASLPHPSSMPPGMPRVPGSVVTTCALRGPADVDFRTSSFGAGLVPVGPPPLSAPETMVPPPLPPLPRLPVPPQQLPGPVRPFVESSLAGPSDKYAAVVSGGFNSAVAGMGTVHGLLGPRLGDVAYLGPVGMSGSVPSGVGNVPGRMPPISSVPGPMPPISGSVNAHGMVRGMFQGPDNVPVRPGLVYPVSSSTFEPANVRPPSRPVLLPGGVIANPGMMSSAPDIGLVRGQVPSVGQSLGSGSGNVELLPAGSTLPPNVGNVGSLHGPAEFSGIRNVIPPDSIRFGLQPEVPRIRAAVPGSLPPGIYDTGRQYVGPIPQIAPPTHGQLSMHTTSGQFAGAPVDQKAMSTGPSERLLNALHSLAGMQTDSLEDHASHASGTNRAGITNSSVQIVDAGMRQTAPEMSRSSFGPRADVGSVFGSQPVRGLLSDQSRMDGVVQGLPRGGLPAPPRLCTGPPRFPLSGSIHFLYALSRFSLFRLTVPFTLHPFPFYQNRPTLFPGRRSLEATEPGFSLFR